MEKKTMFSPRLISSIALALVAILCFTIIGDAVSKPSNYASYVEVLDEKKGKAAALSVAITVASTAVSALPEDTGSNVAGEISELSNVMLLITCIIFMEKFLISVLPFFAFKFIVPAACILLIIQLFRPSEKLKVWICKMGILSLVLCMIIPCSVRVTMLVDDTHAETVAQTIEAAEAAASLASSTGSEESSGVLAFFSNLGESITTLLDSAKNLLSLLIDAVAVLVITTCIIPLVTIILFIWFIKWLLGVQVNLNGISQALPKLAALPGKRLDRNQQESKEEAA